MHAAHDPALSDIEIVEFGKKHLMPPLVALVHQKQGGFGVRIDIFQQVPQKSNFNYISPLGLWQPSLFLLSSCFFRVVLIALAPLF